MVEFMRHDSDNDTEEQKKNKQSFADELGKQTNKIIRKIQFWRSFLDDNQQITFQ